MLARANWAFFENFPNDAKVVHFTLPITVVRIVADTVSLPAPSQVISLVARRQSREMSRMRAANQKYLWRCVLIGFGVGAAIGASGCQVDIGGQTLPSPYYQKDDIQYFPAGPEFKLSREAAAQKAFAEDRAAEEQ
jgi:hypothetical protein